MERQKEPGGAELTAKAKAELAAVETRGTAARIAEVAAMLRCSSTMVNDGGNLLVEAELDSLAAIKRLRAELADLFGVSARVRTVRPGNPGQGRKPPRHLLTLSEGAMEVVRRTGLVGPTGVIIVGLPPQVVSGTISDVEAAWRGAFLARGRLAAPGRAVSLEVTCPREETGLALVGCARRLGMTAKTKETRGVHKVVIREADAIGALLTRMGAQHTRLEWDVLRQAREELLGTNRLVNFDDANLRRSARAAVAAAARVERAMEILGDDVPEHLAEAGYLRVEHRQASLEELGRLADPPMTKDAIAGRIRRLLSMADKKAEEEGLEDTRSALTEDMLDGED
ncbi:MULTISPECIES: DNA-binding protein WhiA [unclassified Corynebacterium]|uniref:DNA-binding protein WhiA n=1 Tax=unclassified Corynebacterium TaxID=2624378 RepID=UPI0029C9DB83|nr:MULTISPECIES: DNA-binding protein WhiA [unclassified Corynebacterium]WPF65139.1 DNA-binding protein WhiA [Corynebacterium sp. 22KM0430]WPF67635.1 DNA-binding protein WhiA [Corynebacterium sp. 21KM1197]